MSRIPQEVIEQVLAAHDVVEVVGRHVPLRQAGRAFKALCPFHDEKTPSFTVNPDRQTFKCFGCGKGGTVFSFLMEHEGLTFPEAVRSLARERGIKVPERGVAPGEEGRVEAVRRALEFARVCYVKALASPEGEEARAYLRQRGYPEEAQRRLGLGYAPRSWDRLVEAGARRGVSARILEEAGLALARDEGGHRDRFRHRVIFPIADLQGRLITFAGRALDPEDNPKYLNGPETVVFRKSSVLYGLDRAKEAFRRTGEALLMEGYTDVLQCHLQGFGHAVAGMGTAFTAQQARLLRRFVPRVVLLYDADEAGRKAAERTLEVLLAEGLEVRVALLPEGRDVDELLLEDGPEALGACLEAALDLLDFKIRATSSRVDVGTPEGRARVGEALVETLLKVPGPVVRESLLVAAAQRLGGEGTEAALRAEAARRLRAQRPARGALRATAYPSRGWGPQGGGASGAREGPAPGGAAGEAPAGGAPTRQAQRAEEDLLAAAIHLPALRGRVLTAVGPEDFASPVLRRVYKALLALEEGAGPWDARTALARLAEDPAAQAALAGLPEDPTLPETVGSHIEFVEDRRRKERERAELLRELGVRPGSDPSGPTREHVGR